MPVILLIRHGENDYVKKNRLAGRYPGCAPECKWPGTGRALAEKLGDAPIKAIYSSPLERALETAAPLAQALGQEVQLRDGLIEVDFGEWQDQRLKALSRTKLWKAVQGLPSRMRFPGGETFADAQQRICREIETDCPAARAKGSDGVCLALRSDQAGSRLLYRFAAGYVPTAECRASFHQRALSWEKPRAGCSA